MAVITPVGKVDFDWSPKEQADEQMVKTASATEEKTDEVVEAKSEEVVKEIVADKTDKDLLYEAAKKVVEAQFGDTEIVEEVAEDVGEVAEVAEDVGEEVAEVSEVSDSGEEKGEEAEVEAVADVQEAVAELVEKAEVADEVAIAVSEAVAVVEEAVEGVKAAVGAEEVAEKSEGVVDEGEKAIDDNEAIEVEVDVLDAPEEGGEDIVQESVEGCGAFAEVKRELTKEASADDFQKISKISPTTRKKVKKFWKDDLGYVSDYCELMVTNYEK